MKGAARVRSVARAGALVAAGLGLGVASLAGGLWLGHEHGSFAAGPWKTNPSNGSVDASLYTRARVALFGLFALDRRETLYYVASTDDAGARLDGRCDYRVEGRDLPARWWSITAYGFDSYLIPNDAHVYSRSKSSVHRRADGTFSILVSADRAEGDFVPVRAGASFDLTARLYNPDDAVRAAPASAAMPRITKERCR